MSIVSDPVSRLLDHLDNVKKSSKGFLARCPGHDDQHNSLSIASGDDGRALLKCHAGCEVAHIVSALGLTMADLFPRTGAGGRGIGESRTIVDTYDYTDEAGTLLYQAVRFQPKDFKQRQPDGHGGWKWNLDGVRRVPYRLPELLDADPAQWVVMLEGEKDCNALAALDFTTTTNAFGADGWHDDYAEFFQGRRVAIIPDNDLAGGRYATRVAQSLEGIATEVRVVRLPGLPAKGDCSDWLDSGGTADALRAMIAETAEWSPDGLVQHDDAGLVLTRQPAGVLARDVEPERITWLSPGRLAAGKCTMLDGDPELGKSTLALDWAACVTRGDALPGGLPGEPRGVVILSAEDGIADTIVPRLMVAGAALDRAYIMTGIRAIDGSEDAVTVPGGLDAVEEAIRQHDAAFLIVDPLMAFLGADVNGNRDQDVRRAMAPLAAMLERTGCAGLLLRHLNKANGGQAIYRGGGSIGIIGAARIGLLAARDPNNDDARVLAPVKVNIGLHPPALRYRLVGAPGSDAAQVVWDAEPVSITAGELLLAASDAANSSELDEAKAWLMDCLFGGARPANEVLSGGKKVGITEITLRRAKQALGVRTTKSGFGSEGSWAWSMPDHELATEPPNVINGPLRRSPNGDDHLRQEMIIFDDARGTSAYDDDAYADVEAGVP